MKKAISLLCLFAIVVLTLCACQEETTAQRCTYYTLKGSWSDVDQLINEYNKQCSNLDMQIAVVEFENENELTNKFLTEVMAGAGPDIMGSSLISQTNVPMEKLVTQNIFMDINSILESDTSSNPLNLNEYNQYVMDAGIVGGKRYFIPTSYSPDVVVTSCEDLAEISDIAGTSQQLTYSDIVLISEKYKSYLFSEENFAKSIFYTCIDGQVDTDAKTANFDDREFIETLDSLKGIVDSYNNVGGRYLQREEYLFSMDGRYSIFDLAAEVCRISELGETPLILNLPTLHNGTSAQINDAIFINENCKNKEVALQFIKFALSEKTQSNMTGADIIEYNPNVSGGFGQSYPVHNEVMDKLFEKCSSIRFDKAFAESYQDSLDINTSNIRLSAEDAEHLRKYIENIRNFSLHNAYSNYNDKVINSITEDYLSSKISLPQFIERLKAVTDIYLNE